MTKIMTLKSALFTALLTLSSIPPLTAQIKLSGAVVDANTQNPLEFAAVALLRSDSSFAAGMLCDSAGHFMFENLSQGDYILSSTFAGYGKTLTPIPDLDSDRDLGAVALPFSGIALNEVTVTGSTVIQKADRKLLIPSATQLKASNSGLSLLQNMQLSRIAINPVSNTVATPGGDPVQLRINGIEVTVAEVVALQPRDIIRIEYHEDPGMRYGNAAAVIDYITRRRDSGGSISTNLTNAFWRLGFGENYLSAKVNHKKSEFGVNARFHNRKVEWTRENRQTFAFPGETLHRDELGQPTLFNEKTLNLALNYNLNEPDRYLFNATLRNNYEDTPNQFSDRIATLYTSNGSRDSSFLSDHSTWWNRTPSLDIYFQRNLKNEQLVILNIVGTYMDSRSTRTYRQEQANREPYLIESFITGKKYSLIAEGIYEKKLPGGKLTGGLRHTQSSTENIYAGNVSSRVGLDVSQTYGYAEYLLSKSKFSYTFGLGVMRTFNSQDGKSAENYILRPSLRAVYNISDNAWIRYNGYVSGYPPSLSDLNNVTQDMDDLQILRGNPNLKTVWFISNTLNAGYNKGIFGAEFYAQYSYDHRPIMERI
ncbi:MAG: carboxypeptidase regulatory-like domain-containing protein, partial [Tannerella sp.]|nr:carboxypeptidase regulatory-like domain-containing protein [Tannerella sp.]